MDSVARGETLQSIAKDYGVSVKDIIKWNKLKSNKVKTGTQLIIRL